MAQNKLHITPENSAEWLASCGFIFPTTEKELERFDKLYADIDPAITGNEVDPFKIIQGIKSNVRPLSKNDIVPASQYKMVARKLNDLPQHIIERIKKNQENSVLHQFGTLNSTDVHLKNNDLIRAQRKIDPSLIPWYCPCLH